MLRNPAVRALIPHLSEAEFGNKYMRMRVHRTSTQAGTLPISRLRANMRRVPRQAYRAEPHEFIISELRERRSMGMEWKDSSHWPKGGGKNVGNPNAYTTTICGEVEFTIHRTDQKFPRQWVLISPIHKENIPLGEWKVEPLMDIFSAAGTLILQRLRAMEQFITR